LFIPDPDPDLLPIPDPESRSQKGTGFRIRNTARHDPDQWKEALLVLIPGPVSGGKEGGYTVHSLWYRWAPGRKTPTTVAKKIKITLKKITT